MIAGPAIPILGPGYAAVPPGHIATIVTSLEMLRPPRPRPPQPLPAGLVLEPLVPTDPDSYRGLFRAVGADWLWFSRLTMPEDALAAILADPRVEIRALRRGGRNVGMLELDFREAGTCELVFLGLTQDLIGTGLGRALMDEAIRRAWSRPIARFWVHTCTLDHPGALAFYRRSGFEPCAVHVEVAPDPRLTGALPRDCAAHIPRLDGASSGRP
jgi:GNAT superfamily N-acetyltransferase